MRRGFSMKVRSLPAVAATVALMLGSDWPASAESEAGFSGLSRSMTVYAGDEFNGAAGTLPDPRLWNHETGGGGWGNDEQQVYTAQASNLEHDGQGNLVIRAMDEGGVITSARINTSGKAELDAGLAAARIQIPAGTGLHPAFWLLGTSLGTAGYPECGEIDTIETIGTTPTAYFTLHGPTQNSASEKREPWQTGTSAGVPDLFSGFHIYWVDKHPGRVVVGIDETPMATFTPDGIPPGAQWVMDSPFFAVLNLAVGGVWPGPVAPGVLPQTMLVDWIRFYR